MGSHGSCSISAPSRNELPLPRNVSPLPGPCRNSLVSPRNPADPQGRFVFRDRLVGPIHCSSASPSRNSFLASLGSISSSRLVLFDRPAKRSLHRPTRRRDWCTPDYSAECRRSPGSRAIRYHAKRSSGGLQRRSGPPAPATRALRRPTCGWATSGGRRAAPGQGEAQPDLRQVHVAVGHRMHADLHQPDGGHEHSQVPEPADRQIGIPPPADQHRGRDGRQNQQGGDRLPRRQSIERMRIEDSQIAGPERLAEVIDVRDQGVADPRARGFSPARSPPFLAPRGRSRRRRPPAAARGLFRRADAISAGGADILVCREKSRTFRQTGMSAPPRLTFFPTASSPAAEARREASPGPASTSGPARRRAASPDTRDSERAKAGGERIRRRPPASARKTARRAGPSARTARRPFRRAADGSAKIAAAKAQAKAAGHPPEDQEEQDGRGAMKQDVGQMVALGLRTVELIVGQVGEPGDRRPLAAVRRGPGPVESFAAEPLADGRVAVEVHLVVVVDEAEVDGLARRPATPPAEAARKPTARLGLGNRAVRAGGFGGLRGSWASGL